ncbi:MAG: TRAP transporter substrate-binding protein DctP [Desulfatiglans sp.]|nr:TRAP transporter substrate-binding protein DctP [Thermodesulfobacteriota bacterium]MEE4352131.1 TRAP transporter substrate-binding protein DctP [Desulfatiglans sp.]
MFPKNVHVISLFLVISLCNCHIGLGPVLAQQKHVIKFATVAPEGSAWINQMKKLDSDIKTMSQGRLGFRIYPGGVAGDELDVLKKMRIGQIHCAAFSGVGFGQILPMVRVLDLPFLFRTYEETDLVHNGLFALFADRFRTKGFELLAWAEVGNVHIFSKQPVRRVADLSGHKIWTWTGDPIAKETFSKMGVNPIPLSITDVTTALNTGMIDTVYAPPLGAVALQWHSSTGYMTALPLVHSTGALLISSGFMKKLPPDLRTLLESVTRRSMSELTSTLRNHNREAIEWIRKAGITITPAPTGQTLKEFYLIHDRVAESLTGKVFPKDVLENVYSILERSR